MPKLRLLILDLILATYVTGCGTAPEGDSPLTNQKAPITSANQNQVEQAAVNNQVNSGKPSEQISYAVADVKGLPECDDARDGQLAYARAEKTFFVCDRGDWAEIDLRGQAGKDGRDGKDGVAGATGAKGEVVAKDPAPRTMTANEFLEAASGLVWVKNFNMVLQADAQTACQALGARLPTELELVRASALGTLLKPAGGFGGFGPWAGPTRQLGQSGVMITSEPTDKGYPYCVETE